RRSVALSSLARAGKTTETAREPERDCRTCGKAVARPEIATVERRRRAPLATGAGASLVPRVPVSWHANRVLTRHPGADRRSATPLRGRGNDATRPRSDAGETRKERENGSQTETIETGRERTKMQMRDRTWTQNRVAGTRSAV